MILYDKEEGKNTYFNFLHKKNRVVNGINRCDSYFIPHRNHIEVDDIVNLPVVDKVPLYTKYIYQIPFRFYRIKSLPVSHITSLLTSLLDTGNLINDINTGTCMLIFDEHAHPCVLTDDIIMRIDVCLRHIGIRKHVYILTCNKHNNNKHGKMFKTIYCEYYEIIAKSLQHKYVSCNEIQADKKRFLCLNLRQRMHRYFLLYNLCNIHNFKKNSILSIKPLTFSWLHSQPEYGMFKNEFSTKSSLVQFMKQLPLTTGYDSTDGPCKLKGERGNVYGDVLLETLYSNSSIFIVTEKEYKYKEKFLFVTEKTFKPIRAKMPFIIYGQPGICKHLQELGYMTFDTIWSEEYDTIYDPVKRCKKIVELITHLNKMSNRDFNIILQKSVEITDHNYANMYKRIPTLSLTSAINEFFKYPVQYHE